MGLTDLFYEFIIELFAVLLAGFGATVGYVKQIDARSRTNKRQLQGDPKDPNAKGVLQIANETHHELNQFYEEFEQFRRETKQDHEAVIRKLEEMNGEHE